MALSIKTKEADELARAVASRTGETMTQAVTTALRERLQRLDADDVMETREAYVARVLASAKRIGAEFDFSKPVTSAEWDWACGDTEGERGF